MDANIPLSTYTKLDLSTDNPGLKTTDTSSSAELGKYIDEVLEENKARVAYGGYLEKRTIYQRSAHFNKQTNPNDERNIHIGLDLWAKAGTPVLAVFDGEIHSFKNNTNYGDYGPTIVVKHRFSELTFYTLYGHLSLQSLRDKNVGQTVRQNEVIGELGTSAVNGDYPPHLHFQLILDIQDYRGDYPGVCSINELDFYKTNCPDPELLLGLSST
ncbi:MAG: peptidoglycan DD-metalloendopeptidase family protein [Crocinitomicaceae bacterium]